MDQNASVDPLGVSDLEELCDEAGYPAHSTRGCFAVEEEITLNWE
jgi:hypothetical protein